VYDGDDGKRKEVIFVGRRGGWGQAFATPEVIG
jgi:hypothetical protein